MGELCYYCGKELDLPHRCPFCNLTFCDEHRLPEMHNCLNLPKREWDTFRDLKNQRENYGWPQIKKKLYKKLKNGSVISNKSARILNSTNSKNEDMSNKKTVTIWLSLLTIGIVFLGLYATGYLEVIIGIFDQKEDFIIYIESDNLNRLTQTNEASRFTINRRDKDTYLYRLYDNNGDFTHKFKFYISSIEPAQIYLRINLISYTDTLGNYYKISTDGGSQIFLSAGSRTNGKFFLVLYETQDTVEKASQESILLDLHNEYEVIIQRRQEHFSIKILDDGVELDEISYILQLHHEINYLMCPQSLGYPNGDLTASGVISDLIL